MAAKIKKGDKVIVLAGRDKGKTCEVLGVFPDEKRALVQGVNIVFAATSVKTAQSEGGIIARESKIDLSNLAAVSDPKDGKPTRVGFQVQKDGKVRVAKRSGEVIDG